MSNASERIDRLERALAAVIDQESFGQILEAAEGYQNLVTSIATSLQDKADPKKPAPGLTPDDKATFIKLQKCFTARKLVLANPNAGYRMSLDDVKAIHKDFKKLFAGSPFPVDTMQLASIKLASTEEPLEPPYLDDNRGTLLPCPTKLRPGEEIVALKITQIGLKDAASYLDPYFNVTVRDAEGGELEQEQDTPHPTAPRKDRVLEFNCTLYVQTPLARLPDDAAIFFEFRHWKPKKNKFSIRCWSMLTIEEIKRHREADLPLEIYAKPVDYKRKKFRRHSVKDLWLHVEVGFVKG